MKSIAIVTGAVSGIGKAIAFRLREEGFYVVLADIDTTAGNELEATWGVDTCKFIACNIVIEHDIVQLMEYCRQSNRRVAVVVNNAGLIRDNMIWKMSLEEFDQVIDVNLRGTWLMCRETAKLFKEQQWGRIINITSRAWLGNPGQSNYAASKAGVVALTRVLALELGRYNVFVNAIAPGLIDTPLTKKLEADVLKKLITAQPTRTMGKPEDVAQLVAFLADEKTQYITGQTFYVDGGKSIGAGI